MILDTKFNEHNLNTSIQLDDVESLVDVQFEDANGSLVFNLKQVTTSVDGELNQSKQLVGTQFGEVIQVGISSETDPTVPEWAKQPEKPTYHISEIKGSDELGGGGVGENVAGTIQTPFDPNEAGGFAYIYEEPQEALEGAEIFNSYEGDRDGMGVENYDRNVAIGFMSQASGFRTQAIGNYSQASGWWTRAEGQCSHAEGLLSMTKGHFCHAEGTRTQATINNAHSEGDLSVASGRQGHAEGNNTLASGYCSHAEGQKTQATNYYSHAEGLGTISAGRQQLAFGKYNIKDTTSLLIAGKGSKDSARSNALTLGSTGNLWVAGTMTSAGADYAELFEWVDGNPNDEDRIGLVVTLDGEKIRLANEGDDILGIVSGTAILLGDNYMHEWKDKYVTDDYGRIVYDEPVEEFTEYIDYVDVADPTTWVTVKESTGFSVYPKINPNYNPNEEYISRENRKEWDAIGMLGKLYVNDDGSCVVGGYATVSVNGIVTQSDTKTNMRVMKRITDNVILVLMK